MINKLEVLNSIRSISGDDSLCYGTEIKNTGMDSMDVLEFIMALEDEFGINIPNAHTISTIGELADYTLQEIIKTEYNR